MIRTFEPESKFFSWTDIGRTVYVYCIYILYVYCMYIVRIFYVYFMYIVYILYVYCMYIVRIYYVYCIYIVCILYVYCMYFVYILYIYCMYIVCILYVYCMYIVWILYVYFIYILHCLHFNFILLKGGSWDSSVCIEIRLRAGKSGARIPGAVRDYLLRYIRPKSEAYPASNWSLVTRFLVQG